MVKSEIHVTFKSVENTEGKDVLSFEVDKQHRRKVYKLVSDINELFAKGKDRLILEVSEYRDKRSVDANAYMWLLCGRIAEVVESTKEEVYRKHIRDCGVFTVVPIKDEAVGRWIQVWQSNGVGWICESLSESKFRGYTNVITYPGSSTYNSKEMARLIKDVADECHMLGIETMTPKELAALCEEWDK